MSYLEEIIQAPADKAEQPLPADIEEQGLEIEEILEIPELDDDIEYDAEPRKIFFSADVEASLRSAVSDHNRQFGSNISKRADIRAVRAVYRRGAGAFTASASMNYNRDTWAKARVRSFLGLLASGRPTNAAYTADNDLLPASHPKSDKRNAESLSNSMQKVQSVATNSLVASIKSAKEFQSPEHAIFALAEYSGLGYDLIPAVRAVWNRATEAHENPFERAYNFVANLYSSTDADLLPKQETNNG